MPRSEHIQPLKNCETQKVRVTLPIEESEFVFHINALELEDLARFLGFSHISVVSHQFSPVPFEEGQTHRSKVSYSSEADTAIKKRWKEITIYLDVQLLRKLYPVNTDFLSSTDIAIKTELLEQSREDLKSFSHDRFVLLDCLPTLAIAAVGQLAAQVIGRETTPLVMLYALSGGFIAKVFFSNLHTLILRELDVDARFTLLEATQAERLLLAPLKTNTSFMHMHPKL